MKNMKVIFMLLTLSNIAFSTQEEYHFQEIPTLEFLEENLSEVSQEQNTKRISNLSFKTIRKGEKFSNLTQNEKRSLEEVRDNSSSKLISKSQTKYSITNTLGVRLSGSSTESPKENNAFYSTSLLLSYRLHENENSEMNFLSGVSYESYRSKEKIEQEKEKKENFRESMTPVFKTGLELKF